MYSFVKSDTSELSFSKKQNEIFEGWKRPTEIFNDSGPELFENIMMARTDCDLVQDITTDCSVVASLCAVMRHLKPDKKNSVSSRSLIRQSTLAVGS
jgi:hypothetical protein